MSAATISANLLETERHSTAWIEAGPGNGPLMIFLHGWPELSIIWRHQLLHFASKGWRCVAPDMRGYGGSSVPRTIAAYALSEIVADMIDLHDALGGAPAVWVGHDWGSAVVWALAAHHGERCRGAVSLCVPYLARGFALESLVPLVDRELYPADEHPVGQWDYWLYYYEQFTRAAQAFDADVDATFRAIYRRAAAQAVPAPARTAGVRARGGWFGGGPAPGLPRDTSMMSQADHERYVATFGENGFGGPDAWYMNDTANLQYAAQAPDFGRLTLPVLFVHADRDSVCRTVDGRLADPMRADCATLDEVAIDAGHMVMLERPAELDTAIANWLQRAGLAGDGGPQA